MFAALVLACTAETEPAVPAAPTLGETVVEVPAAGLPVEPNVANNNLAVLEVEGRTFLAWRTADTHFAGPEVQMHVISREGEGPWAWETTVALGTDVREPQLVVIDGSLRL